MIPPLPGQKFKMVKNADGEEIEARLDEAENVIRVPGVTTITKHVGDPGGLIQWAVDQTAAYCVAHLDQLAMRTEEQGWGYARYYHKRKPDITDPLRTAHSGVLDDLAQLGTNIHDWVEIDLMRNDFPPEIDSAEMEQMIEAWEEFKFLHQIDPVATEVTLWNIAAGYAGTFDLLAYIDGVLYLIDLKTSRKVGDAHLMQIAALRAAFFADGAFYKDGDEWRKLELPTPEKYGILQLRPDDDDGPRRYHLEAVSEVELDLYMERFLAALTVNRVDFELKQLKKSDKVSNKEEN